MTGYLSARPQTLFTRMSLTCVVLALSVTSLPLYVLKHLRPHHVASDL